MKVDNFFTSDTHFNHSNIIKYCKRIQYLTSPEEVNLYQKYIAHGIDFKVGYKSTQYMNDCLINNINSVVGEDDILWHLGDFCWFNRKNYDKAYYDIYNLRARIKCRNINLILGNHDCNRLEDPELIKIFELIFTNVLDKAIFKVNGQRIVADHYANAIWYKSHRSAWHIYGHSHSNAEQYLDKCFPNRLSLDVGVDNAIKILGESKPFSFKDLSNYFNDKKGHTIDHHVQDV
jgi:calcineurin-like phosphoesterase family protein